MEKRRAKQNMEDLEKLHSKEVLSYRCPWLSCLYLQTARVTLYSQCTPRPASLELVMPGLQATGV